MRPGPPLRPRRRAVAVAATAVALLLSGALGACSSEEAGPSGSDGTAAGPPTSAGADPGDGPTTIADTPITLVPVVGSGLDAPVAMAPVPHRDELWVAEQGGRIRRVRLGTDGGSAATTLPPTATTERDEAADPVAPEWTTYDLVPEPVLDLGELTEARGERGLLGLAFSSDGRTLYVDHTLADSGDVVVASYDVAEDGTVDPATRTVLLQIPHRQFANHNGGQLVLGPDGYLYIGIGDGGGSGDPDDNAQDTDTLLGSILRIDPEGAAGDEPYAIPSSNPFADGVDGAPELYLYGARNPWRFSFDSLTGDLWVADVGQDEIEEIDWLPAADGSGLGANLGWPWFEGDQPFRDSGTPPDGLIGPIATTTHADGNCSIVGGYVYRGRAVPDLDGVYLYGDYCKGQVRGLLARNGVVLDDAPLGPALDPSELVSFGQDGQGELYVISAGGQLLKVEAS